MAYLVEQGIDPVAAADEVRLYVQNAPDVQVAADGQAVLGARELSTIADELVPGHVVVDYRGDGWLGGEPVARR